MAGPTIEALTGSDLPLAANGGIGVVSKIVRERLRTISVERIWPASALLMTRAAVLIASPKTRYARRYGGPKSPVKTLPVLTPMRIGTRPACSMISRRVAEHPLLVVPGARRRAGGQQRLDARLADVGLVEGHLVAQRRLLDGAHPLVEAAAQRLGPDLLEQPVRVHHVDEGGRDRPMLGLALAQQDVVPCRDRDGRRDVEALDVADERRALALDLGRRAQERDAVLLLPMQAGPSARTSAGLMPISPASAMASMDSVSVMAGPAISSSRWTLPVMKKWNGPVPMPTDIRSDDRAAAQVQPADAIDGALHLPGRPGGPQRVVGAVEHEEQRVAAPLEQAGAPVVGLVEERREHAVERVAHELGADLALSREPFGEGREARDVDEDEGGLDLAVELGRVGAEPIDDESRHVRPQEFVLRRVHAGRRHDPALGGCGRRHSCGRALCMGRSPFDHLGRRTRLHRRAPQPPHLSAGRRGSPPAPRPRR